MEIEDILKTIIHPESGMDIVALGMVGNVKEDAQSISLTLRMPKAHDAAANSLRRAVEAALFEATSKQIKVIVSEPAPENKKELAKAQMKANSTTSGIKNVIAVSSGKGGVGKSSVTCNLAIVLKDLGYKVGVLDGDIYGPSMPKMFDLENYHPLTESEESENIMPAIGYGIKVMSIGFFIEADKALVWRGPMATSALRQMVHQTAWGELDYLLIDLPPGTGDVHLTIVNEIKIDKAIIVTTPQAVALADVVRGIAMFKSEHINVDVAGIVENMAFFSPNDNPQKKYFIFGQGKIEKVVSEAQLPILAQIPIDESIASGSDDGRPYCELFKDSLIYNSFLKLANKIL